MGRLDSAGCAGCAASSSRAREPVRGNKRDGGEGRGGQGLDAGVFVPVCVRVSYRSIIGHLFSLALRQRVPPDGPYESGQAAARASFREARAAASRVGPSCTSPA